MAKENGGRLKGFFAEFKKFITRGNVLDMSVGVIVGGAFTAIVNGMSNFILKPIINALIAVLLGKDGLEGAVTMLSPAYLVDETGATVIDMANSIYIDWGSFISAIINFLLIAFVLFTIVKIINRIAAAQDKFADEQLLVYKRKKILRGYRKEGMSKSAAQARYNAEIKKAAEDKAEAERIEAENATAAARLAEEKATANTRLLQEIRDLLKANAEK
jgi:large conductance mechanosensitive channel